MQLRFVLSELVSSAVTFCDIRIKSKYSYILCYLGTNQYSYVFCYQEQTTIYIVIVFVLSGQQAIQLPFELSNVENNSAVFCVIRKQYSYVCANTRVESNAVIALLYFVEKAQLHFVLFGVESNTITFCAIKVESNTVTFCAIEVDINRVTFCVNRDMNYKVTFCAISGRRQYSYVLCYQGQKVIKLRFICDII